jgi:hypothetical protein
VAVLSSPRVHGLRLHVWHAHPTSSRHERVSVIVGSTFSTSTVPAAASGRGRNEIETDAFLRMRAQLPPDRGMQTNTRSQPQVSSTAQVFLNRSERDAGGVQPISFRAHLPVSMRGMLGARGCTLNAVGRFATGTPHPVPHRGRRALHLGGTPTRRAQA